MADTAIAITAGTGTNVDTRTESTNGNHRQVIVLGDPASNTAVAAVKDASTAPVATDPALVVAISPNSVNANGQATMANSAPVVFASNQSDLPVKPGSTETAATGVTIGTSGVGYLGWLSSIAKLLSGSLAVTGTFWQATQPVSGAVNLAPATSGGLAVTGVVTTAAAIVGNVKASAGQLYKIEVSNNSASWIYLKIYNTAGSPTAGVGTPVRRLGIPPTSVLLTTSDIGDAYATGIGYAIVGGAPDADSSAVAANVLVNFFWK